MKCPNCGLPLVTLELGNTEIDYCAKCRGIWLDEREIEILLEDAEEATRVLERLQRIAVHKEKAKRCPLCLKRMEKVNCGVALKAITIDRCPAFHGFWFDRGELSAVLEAGSLDNGRAIIGFLRQMFPEKR